MTVAADPGPPRFRWLPQVLVALGCAVVTPFTALAWPFALFTGFLVGRVLLLRRQGALSGGRAKAIAWVAIGGLISFAIVALAAESERRAASGSTRQQVLARVLVVVLPTLVWLLLLSGPVPAAT